MFATFTPVVGRTDAEAQAKYDAARANASIIGGLVLFSGWTGIDISRIPLDQEITAEDSTEGHRITSLMETLTAPLEDAGGTGGKRAWTPRLVAERAAVGGLGPVGVGCAARVADELERWVREADLDGFNLGYVTTPGTFEEVVELLIPELRRRGVYGGPLPMATGVEGGGGGEGLTAREKIYGVGQRQLRADHPGSRYKYEVYREEEEER